MKLLKYLAAILFILFILVNVLTRLPIVQDRIMMTALNNAVNATAELPDNALSALVCGSGPPLTSPGAAQSCILIKAGDEYFIVDIGDGASANLMNWGIDVQKVKAVFLTHLHSDHIADLAELHLMNWVTASRQSKLKVYGPEGVSNVTEGFEATYALDYKFRNEHHGNEIAPIEVAGFDPYTINLDEPVIYNKNDLKVTAFEVEHDPVPAVGFKFDYKGRSIVISGDTKYSQKVIDGAKNADVLFHENQANHILEMMNKPLMNAGRPQAATVMKDIVTYHTTPTEAADIANKANVDHLVFYHHVPYPRISIMERVHLRGVNEVRSKDKWTFSRDGTLIVLPLNSDEIKPDIISKEQNLIAEELKNSGKPDEIAKKICLGKINKFKEENSLMTQQWVMEPKKKVKDILKELNIANLKISEFSRIKIGE